MDPRTESLVSNTKTQMTTQTLTRVELDRRISTAGLSGPEERALRMRYGLAMELDGELEFADAAQPAAQAEIAALERQVIAHLNVDAHARRKQHIIDELREL